MSKFELFQTENICVTRSVESTRCEDYFDLTHSTFSQTHKVGNNGISAYFVFPYICSFLHYLDAKILINMKLDVTL